jgi:hypothetical protein
VRGGSLSGICLNLTSIVPPDMITKVAFRFYLKAALLFFLSTGLLIQMAAEESSYTRPTVTSGWNVAKSDRINDGH